MSTRRTHVGADTARLQNRRLLTGEATYVADLNRPGQVFAKVVRSSLAHAHIVSVDTSEARQLPGVLDVITAADLPDVRIPIRLPFADTVEARQALQPPLATDIVRYVGEPVAVVVATDPYEAEEASELIDVEFEELPPLLDPRTAAQTGQGVLHEALGTNVVNSIPLSFGNVDEAFGRAHHIVRDTLRIHRHTAIPMETRGLLAEFDPTSEQLTVWGAAKVKHFTRNAVAAMLGMDPAHLELIEVNVGGGFGVRGEPYPEDFLIPFLARRLGRPVKWIEDRAEHFVATNHAREQEYEFELAASEDGEFLAFRSRAWCDHGGYVRSQGILPELLPTVHLPGPYKWQAFSIESSGVLTNRTPVGTYRGPGMTQATFVRERMIDQLASELNLDPAELRLRNLITHKDLPYQYQLNEGSASVPPIRYESGDFTASLTRLLEHVGYAELLATVAERRAAGSTVGVGLAVYVEVGSIGPFEDAAVVASDDGTWAIHVGVSSLGQGVETVLSQIAADALGAAPADIRIALSSTKEVDQGFGSFASRATVLAGNAVAMACTDLRKAVGAELGCLPDDVVFESGRASAPDGRSISSSEVGPGRGRFEKPTPSFSFGAAFSVVDVQPETGRIQVLRHVVLHDVGRAVNPALLRGQLVGAAAQGIGAALFEELGYDDNGQPQSTSFADYLMPTSAEIPDIEVIIEEQPTTANPLGIKGGGESGMVATPAAVANAVADALGPVGQTIARLPLTPNRVRELVRTSSSPGSTVGAGTAP